jgi:hypothetical protein
VAHPAAKWANSIACIIRVFTKEKEGDMSP